MKREMVEEIGNNIKERKKMSKEYEAKVNKRIFSNILLGILVLAYLVLIMLGFKNIEENILIVDLKVFSIGILCIAVILFEKSYKKEDGKLCLYGVEMLILAIMTLVGIYVLKIVPHLFMTIVSALAVVVAIYYVIKSIGIYSKSKKKYIKNQNDIKEIIKEEEPEKVETKKKKYVEEEQEIPYVDPMEALNSIKTEERIVVEPKEEEKPKKVKEEIVKEKKKKVTENIKDSKPIENKSEIKEENLVENSMNQKLEMLEKRIKANSQKMAETTNKSTKMKQVDTKKKQKETIVEPEKKEVKEKRVEPEKKEVKEKKVEEKKESKPDSKTTATKKTTKKTVTKKPEEKSTKKIETVEKIEKVTEKKQENEKTKIEDPNAPKTVAMSPFDMEIAGITPEDLDK